MALACVLDASSALRLILGDCAAEDLTEPIRAAVLVLAPELMLTEVANTLWKRRRTDQLNDPDPQQLLADARDLAWVGDAWQPVALRFAPAPGGQQWLGGGADPETRRRWRYTTAAGRALRQHPRHIRIQPLRLHRRHGRQAHEQRVLGRAPWRWAWR